jgi:hypothetical protein
MVLSLFNLNMAKQLLEVINTGHKNINDFKELLSHNRLKDKITSQIIILYIDFLNDIKNIIENHNNNFLNNETISESIEN